MKIETKIVQTSRQIAKPKSAGFTLIELLVVIAVIGLLASVVLVALNSSRAKSRDAKRIADMNQMAKAMELYFNNYNSYPTLSAPGILHTSLVGVPPIVPNTLGRLPAAPQPADGTCTSTTSGGNNYWMYANVAGTQMVTSTYVITFCLGAVTGSLSAGPHTLTESGFR